MREQAFKGTGPSMTATIAELRATEDVIYGHRNGLMKWHKSMVFARDCNRRRMIGHYLK